MPTRVFSETKFSEKAFRNFPPTHIFIKFFKSFQLMKVLIACEESATVRNLFAAKGHDAWSCDLKETRDKSGNHYKGSVFDILDNGWDLMIAHPPCTHLTVSGNGSRAKKQKDGRLQDAIDFFMAMMNTPIHRIAVENPIGIMSSIYRPPDQIIQPYFFGDRERKSTCLWLKNLPKLFYAQEDDLFATKTVVEPKLKTIINKNGIKKTFSRFEYAASKKHGERAEIRSKTFPGIAMAMAEQWG